MILTEKSKLKTTPEEAAALAETIRIANEFCNWLSEKAFSSKIFSKRKLQIAFYLEGRRLFPSLNSQMVIRCIAKVADSYKADKASMHEFHPRGSISFDARNLILNLKNETVSIGSVRGRLKAVKLALGERQRQNLQKAGKIGESDLVFIDGNFYLLLSYKVKEPILTVPVGVLALDLGINNIAVSSDGKFFDGSQVKAIRSRHEKLRAKLQSNGSRSAKRKLKRRSKKEHRFMTDINHIISKEFVEDAVRTKRAIGVEILTNIKKNLWKRVSKYAKKLRKQINDWAFYQLRQFVEYKARRAGVLTVAVNPAFSSQECSKCHRIHKDNRKTQSKFICHFCGFRKHADLNGANVVKRRVGAVAVNLPIVAGSRDLDNLYCCSLVTNPSLQGGVVDTS